MKKYIIVFLISMVPLIELRGAIPYAVGFGLPTVPSYIIAVIGNMLPVPFIFLFARVAVAIVTSSPRRNWTAAKSMWTRYWPSGHHTRIILFSILYTLSLLHFLSFSVIIILDDLEEKKHIILFRAIEILYFL